MTSPPLDGRLRLGSAAEPFEAQVLVAKFAIAAFRNTRSTLDQTDPWCGVVLIDGLISRLGIFCG
jgi:hypothetical protein